MSRRCGDHHVVSPRCPPSAGDCWLTPIRCGPCCAQVSLHNGHTINQLHHCSSISGVRTTLITAPLCIQLEQPQLHSRAPQPCLDQYQFVPRVPRMYTCLGPPIPSLLMYNVKAHSTAHACLHGDAPGHVAAPCLLQHAAPPSPPLPTVTETSKPSQLKHMKTRLYPRAIPNFKPNRDPCPKPNIHMKLTQMPVCLSHTLSTQKIIVRCKYHPTSRHEEACNLLLLLGCWPVHANNHGVISLIGLQGDLLLGLELHLLQLLDLHTHSVHAQGECLSIPGTSRCSET